MTWTAPKITRMDEPTSGGEREQLESWLDYHRQTLLLKCSGLTAEQLRQRSVPPSALSLLGLVRHMADVERSWFRRRFAGEDVSYLWFTEENLDADFDDVDGADPQEAFDALAAEVALARSVAAGRSLDDTFVSRSGVTLTLRWVYLHMIEEYARHNGHADLLRERIDGATGD
ncbi:DinB family protein [Frankia sp. CNm7]|uniref:DinB family protein n=1 Tax=Frankia nepalensis TaxID=1836974 RepID=A0A937RAE1_9ACTN|nr:DinB family protein [Frankia nepalensis]MBL7498203.1 DinB family protein [Frankia nepalensis]MBL7513949.1 DinB family protein [Frankia nepalensis]MBL7522233.1 DinB family protein [Frankia nepalensis]MBL7628401.1 DinB family protein [Frankia nepalensis]